MAGGGVIVTTLEGAARIRNIHGGVGEIKAKRLATGNMMYARTGTLSSTRSFPRYRRRQHVHTRTEELFFVLSGKAVIGLGDEKVEVGPGDVVLTPLGGVQSVQAVGDDPYRMIVIEALPPEIVRALPAHSPSAEARS